RRHTRLQGDWSSDVCSSDLSVERANEELYRAKQQAEAASSLKSSVLISVTHDLLQPLNAARLTLSALTEMMESQEAGLLIDQAEIGRASCRERGWVVVVAG